MRAPSDHPSPMCALLGWSLPVARCLALPSVWGVGSQPAVKDPRVSTSRRNVAPVDDCSEHMGCLPTRCQCEERILAPFVAHYNRNVGTSFAFVERLDLRGPKPQPEALYRDGRSSASLVVERKSLVCAGSRQDSQQLAHGRSACERAIRPHLDPEKAYKLAMPSELHGRLPVLRAYGSRIAAVILRNLAAVHRGQTLESTTPYRKWRFRLEDPHERDWDEPAAGLRVAFNVKSGPLDWGESPQGLDTEVCRLLEAAARKFESHAEALRILVIEPIGDLHISDAPVLSQLLEAAAVPPDIDEIWISSHVLVTELSYGWGHQQIWPSSVRCTTNYAVKQYRALSRYRFPNSRPLLSGIQVRGASLHTRPSSA